jgi:hypothetical protein
MFHPICECRCAQTKAGKSTASSTGILEEKAIREK